MTQYQIVNVAYSGTEGWTRRLQYKLNTLARDGWRPISFSDQSGAVTIMMEKSEEPNKKVYQVLNSSWSHSGWILDFEEEINGWAKDGYKILYCGDSSRAMTIIMEK